DAILVLDVDVPWTPVRKAPSSECKIIHIGVDPLFSRYPIRGFPCDVAITGATRLVMPALGAALAPLAAAAEIADRRQRVAEQREAHQAAVRREIDEAQTMRQIHMGWVAACLDKARDPNSTLISEYTLVNEHCGSTKPGHYFASSPASGLGWGAGAALGVKLARPDQQVIAV